MAVRWRSAAIGATDKQLLLKVLEFGDVQQTISVDREDRPVVLLETDGRYNSVYIGWRDGNEVKGLALAHVEKYIEASEFAKQVAKGIDVQVRELGRDALRSEEK